VDAMPLSTWFSCQDTIRTSNQIHLPVEITIAMLTMLVEFGAQRWTSWRLTLMPGTQHHTPVVLHPVNITGIVIKVAVVNLFIKLIHMLMVQETGIESIPSKLLPLK
jgi:hypothetical protein